MIHLKSSCCKCFPAPHGCSTWSHCGHHTWSPTPCCRREWSNRASVRHKTEKTNAWEQLYQSGLPQVDVLQAGFGRIFLAHQLPAVSGLQLVDRGRNVSSPLIPLLSGASFQKVIHSMLGLEFECKLVRRKNNNNEEEKKEHRKSK